MQPEFSDHGFGLWLIRRANSQRGNDGGSVVEVLAAGIDDKKMWDAEGFAFVLGNEQSVNVRRKADLRSWRFLGVGNRLLEKWGGLHLHGVQESPKVGVSGLRGGFACRHLNVGAHDGVEPQR